MWAQTPAPEPGGPNQYLPYGDDPRTTQYVGVDDLVTQAGEERHEPDAFAHLFRDQQQGGHLASDPPSVPGPAAAPGGPSPAPQYQAPSAPAPTADETLNLGAMPAAAPASSQATAKKGGRATGLLKSSAVMAAGTMVSASRVSSAPR